MRRRDHWITWLELGASILWWWNPLFWYVRRQLRETAEMSCDALAIAAHPESRREYAELLLRLSSQSTNDVPVPVIAMGAGNVASFEKRLKMILSSSVSGSLSWRGAVAIALLAVIALPYWSLAQSTNLEPSPTLAQQSDTAKESRKATEPDHDNDSIVVGEKPDTSANKVPSSTHQFIAAKPNHVNFVSSGTAEILNDRSVQRNPTDQWQEYALHFSPADLPSKISVANVSHEELLRTHGVITLQKWASVTGTLKLDGKPQAGETIELHFDTLPWSYSRGGPRLTTVHRTTTDKDGNFSFDRVPPLGGIAHARALGGTVYQCESGKNTHIEFGVGRIWAAWDGTRLASPSS